MDSGEVSRSDPDGGSLRAVLQALAAPQAAAALCVVVATEGSTYRKPGALILLPRQGPRTGWLSGGCLEAELEQVAQQVITQGAAQHVRFDTRGDDDLVFGYASGCRGVIEALLLPLSEQAPLLAGLRALRAGCELQLELDEAGAGRAQLGQQVWQWADAAARPPRWRLRLHAPPRLLLLGAGPETAPLLRIVRLLGWQVEVVEQRTRWFPALAQADHHYNLPADAAATLLAQGHYDAAVVMSHHYSRDLAFLRLCAQSKIDWIGLLGPPARREALLGELAAADRQRLLPRLQAPVGLRLGGEGPEAIALSIAAALQARPGPAA
jgi:xanthine dehydrogenase accessory factor